MNFFQRHMTLKERIVLFLGAFFTALLFCRNAAENSVTGWLVTYFKDSGIPVSYTHLTLPTILRV